MEIGSISLRLLISVPIIVIRINLPVADLLNKLTNSNTFHILNLGDTLRFLFIMFAFTSVQLYRLCLHTQESLQRACFYPSKSSEQNCENDNGNNTHGTYIVGVFFFSTHFTLPPSGALDKMDDQLNKFFILHPGSVLFQYLR